MKYPLMGVAALICIGVSGCSTYAVNRYSICPENVVVLRAHRNSPIAVGGFSSSRPDLRELTCRMVGPIQTPDKTTFAEYIRQAFIGELQMAEVYSKESLVVIAGNLDDIHFSSTSGKWYISLTLMSGADSLSVQTTYDYSSSLFGETACNQTAQALVPAVQELIKSVITHPGFEELLKAEEGAQGANQ